HRRSRSFQDCLCPGRLYRHGEHDGSAPLHEAVSDAERKGHSSGYTDERASVLHSSESAYEGQVGLTAMRFNSFAARTAFRAVQREFGEVVRIEPRKEADYTDALPDQSRPARQLTAVVALTPTLDKFEGSREGSRINTGLRVSVREA